MIKGIFKHIHLLLVCLQRFSPNMESVLQTTKRYNSSLGSSIDLIFIQLCFSNFHTWSLYLFKMDNSIDYFISFLFIKTYTNLMNTICIKTPRSVAYSWARKVNYLETNLKAVVRLQNKHYDPYQSPYFALRTLQVETFVLEVGLLLPYQHHFYIKW